MTLKARRGVAQEHVLEGSQGAAVPLSPGMTVTGEVTPQKRLSGVLRAGTHLLLFHNSLTTSTFTVTRSLPPEGLWGKCWGGTHTLMSTGKPTMERSPGNVGSAKDFSSHPSYFMCHKSHGQAPRRCERYEKALAMSAKLNRYFQKLAGVGS